MKYEEQMDVHREIWNKHNVLIKEGKLEPFRESFVWYGRDHEENSFRILAV
jgi:hypothetical protein